MLYKSSPQSLKVSRTETERAKSSGDSFLAERLAKLEKEVEFHRRNQVQPSPSHPQPVYMVTPNMAHAPSAPQSWPAGAAATGTASGGSWGGMTQYYHPTQ